MGAALYFGYGLIAISAVLLAQHWQQWRDWRALPTGRRRTLLRGQIQRRFVASALIGVVGAAMTLVDHVQRTPIAMSTYLIALVLGGSVIFLIALADVHSTRRMRHEEQLELFADELRKLRAKPRSG